MRVPDACRYIGISRSTLYLLIADGELEIIKLGCSTLVLTESLKALIPISSKPSSLPQSSGCPTPTRGN
jgi:excisionase family DNA binding protein